MNEIYVKKPVYLSLLSLYGYLTGRADSYFLLVWELKTCIKKKKRKTIFFVLTDTNVVLTTTKFIIIVTKVAAKNSKKVIFFVLIKKEKFQKSRTYCKR